MAGKRAAKFAACWRRTPPRILFSQYWDARGKAARMTKRSVVQPTNRFCKGHKG